MFYVLTQAGSLSPDSPRSEQDDQVVISKRGEEDFECDFAAPSKGVTLPSSCADTLHVCL
jgi:hypothetical protein